MSTASAKQKKGRSGPASKGKRTSPKSPRVRHAVKQHKNSIRTASRKTAKDWLKPYEWKPGQTGNPKGRPKIKALTEAYEAILEAKIPGDPDGRTFAQAIAQVMIASALRGNVKATREITDRVEGRAKQAVELSTPIPLSIDITSVLDRVYSFYPPKKDDGGAKPE